MRLAARSLETRTDHEEDTGAPWPPRLERRDFTRSCAVTRPGSRGAGPMRGQDACRSRGFEPCASTGPPIRIHTGRFPSGQRGQTVNLMALPSQVRILFSPPPPSGLTPAARVARLAQPTCSAQACEWGTAALRCRPRSGRGSDPVLTRGARTRGTRPARPMGPQRAGVVQW